MSACRRFNGFKVPIGNGCLLIYRILLLLAIIGGYAQSKQHVEYAVIDEDGIINIDLDWKIRKMFICYPVKASSNGNAKFVSRFRTGNNNKSSEIVNKCRNANENNGTIDFDWSGFIVNYNNYLVEIETAYGTKCNSVSRLFFTSIHIELKTGIVYGDHDPSQSQKLVCNGDKKKDFEKEQIYGAFLLDYIDMWFLCNDVNVNKTKNLQTTTTSTSMTTTTTITYKLVEMDEQCTYSMEKVKPAYIDDEYPEYVVRFGYVFHNSSSITKLRYPQTNQLGFHYDYEIFNLSIDEFDEFTDNYNDFFYAKIPNEIVNDEGIVLMHFMNCEDTIFAGYKLEKDNGTDQSVLKEENDWSKDFDYAKNCEQKLRMRIDDEKHQFDMPYYSKDLGLLEIDADVALPVKIGIILQPESKLTDAQIQAHRYFYGHRNFPKCSIRPHLVEELNNYARSKKYGRYLTDYVEFYKPAKPHSLQVKFRKVSFLDVQEYYPVPDEEFNKYRVTPELNQQYYRCGKDGKDRIFTSRFDAAQLTNITLEGKILHLRFTNLTKVIKLDGEFYDWNNDPSKLFLEKERSP